MYAINSGLRQNCVTSRLLETINDVERIMTKFINCLNKYD